MSRLSLTVFLGVALLITALGVVYSSHVSRQSFIEWQELVQQGHDHEVEWGRLLIEKSSLASFAQLESLVNSNLKMVAPSTGQIVVVQGEKK
jgi:cell division protein FtsL